MKHFKAQQIARLVHSDAQPPKNPYDALGDGRKYRCRESARRILWELTSPTDEQLIAADRVFKRMQSRGGPLSVLDIADIYREMIRAIIPPVGWKD